MWNLPGPGIKLVSPTVAWGLLTTVPPEKSPLYFFMSVFSTRMHVPWRQKACPSLSRHNCSFNLGNWQMGYTSRFMLTIQHIHVNFFKYLCMCFFDICVIFLSHSFSNNKTTSFQGNPIDALCKTDPVATPFPQVLAFDTKPGSSEHPIDLATEIGGFQKELCPLDSHLGHLPRWLAI